MKLNQICPTGRASLAALTVIGGIASGMLGLSAGALAQPAAQQPPTAAMPPQVPAPIGPFPPIAAPARLDDVVLTGAAAKRARDRSLLRFDVAERIAKACFAQAARNKQNVTVFILDQFGETIYAGRMDGQYAINIDTALMKAKTALYTRDSTHAAMNRGQGDMMQELRAMQLGMYPTTGGLPIIVEDQLLGAIGVGGGRQDEACAWEGLQTVLGPQPPLLPTLPPRPR